MKSKKKLKDQEIARGMAKGMVALLKHYYDAANGKATLDAKTDELAKTLFKEFNLA